MTRFICAICGLLFLVANCSARDSVSVLDFGSTETGKTVAEKLRARFRGAGDFLVAGRVGDRLCDRHALPRRPLPGGVRDHLAPRSARDR